SFGDVAGHDDASLGVVVGAIEADYARQTSVPAERVVVFPDAASALAGVQAGRVDAYAATALTVSDLLRKGTDGIERAEPFTDPEIDGKSVRGHGAFAFRTDDTELRDAFNGILTDYLGTPDHAQAVESFGFTAAELPGDVTAALLCKG
ncbi:MAG: transporter substrate-binding domain-containing protein, partial [Pigmentiphaga sp.]